MNYIPADKLNAEIERLIKCTELHRGDDVADASRQTLYWMKDFVTSLQQDEKAIELIMCNQAYWEDMGYIMIPPNVTLRGIETLLKQVRKKLQHEQPALLGIEDPGIPGKDFIPVEWVDACEMYGKWKIVKQEQPELDLEKFTDKIKTFQERYKYPEIVSIKGAMAFMARMFYQYPNAARQWYDSLPKATMD